MWALFIKDKFVLSRENKEELVDLQNNIQFKSMKNDSVIRKIPDNISSVFIAYHLVYIKNPDGEFTIHPPSEDINIEYKKGKNYVSINSSRTMFHVYIWENFLTSKKEVRKLALKMIKEKCCYS